MIKCHEIKNVTDFDVADSMRCDIKILVTKTRYTVFVVAAGQALEQGAVGLHTVGWWTD